jgi:SPP1 family predicted phage head-tail adaptor
MAESRQRNRIGSLRQRVTIQTITKTPDGLGGWVHSWGELATVWADLFPLSGREIYAQGQVLSPVTHKCIIRFRDDVTTKHRISYGGQAYNIRAALNLNARSEWLELHLESGVAT